MTRQWLHILALEKPTEETTAVRQEVAAPEATEDGPRIRSL